MTATPQRPHRWGNGNAVVRWPHCTVCGVIFNKDKRTDLAECRGVAPKVGPRNAWQFDYDTMTPAALLETVRVGYGSPPLRYRDGSGYCEVCRTDAGWHVRSVLTDASGMPPTILEETYEDEHAAFGALSALGPWKPA